MPDDAVIIFAIIVYLAAFCLLCGEAANAVQHSIAGTANTTNKNKEQQ